MKKFDATISYVNNLEAAKAWVTRRGLLAAERPAARAFFQKAVREWEQSHTGNFWALSYEDIAQEAVKAGADAGAAEKAVKALKAVDKALASLASEGYTDEAFAALGEGDQGRIDFAAHKVWPSVGIPVRAFETVNEKGKKVPSQELPNIVTTWYEGGDEKQIIAFLYKVAHEIFDKGGLDVFQPVRLKRSDFPVEMVRHFAATFHRNYTESKTRSYGYGIEDAARVQALAVTDFLVNVLENRWDTVTSEAEEAEEAAQAARIETRKAEEANMVTRALAEEAPAQAAAAPLPPVTEDIPAAKPARGRRGTKK